MIVEARGHLKLSYFVRFLGARLENVEIFKKILKMSHILQVYYIYMWI